MERERRTRSPAQETRHLAFPRVLVQDLDVDALELRRPPRHLGGPHVGRPVDGRFEGALRADPSRLSPHLALLVVSSARYGRGMSLTVAIALSSGHTVRSAPDCHWSMHGGHRSFWAPASGLKPSPVGYVPGGMSRGARGVRIPSTSSAF